MDEREPTGDSQEPGQIGATPGDGPSNPLPWHHPLPPTGWTPVAPTPLWAHERGADEQAPTAQHPTAPIPPTQAPIDPWARPAYPPPPAAGFGPFAQGADQPPAPPPPGAGG